MISKRRFSNKRAVDANDKKYRRWWREPLIHFFVLGLAVFGLHAVLERQQEDHVVDSYLVEVSSADVEWMRTLFNKQMGREPTVQDLRAQVNQLIREQILSREAVAMGLDEGDIVVRRRLAQKVEFLFNDLSAMTDPSEDELRRFYTENPGKYEIPPQITFTQVYFNTDSRGVAGAKQAAQGLIKADVDPRSVEALGDPSILPLDASSVVSEKSRTGLVMNSPSQSKASNRVRGTDPLHRPTDSTPFTYMSVRIENYRHSIILLTRSGVTGCLPIRKKNTRKVYEEIRSRYQVLVEGLPYDSDVKG